MVAVLGSDPEQAQDWVDSWAHRVSARAAAAAELSARVAGITASATGADGAVTVTVAASGVMTGLALDDRVRRLPAPAIAEAILDTMRRAQAALAVRVASEVRDTVGTDSESGRAVVDSYARRFPPPPDEPEVSHGR